MKRFFVSVLLATTLLSLVPGRAGAATGSPTAKYLCLLVLDAGRPDYITQNLASMPNMRTLLQRSRVYDRAWVGDLMSITPPSHAVIGSGSFPKNDGGIVNWDWGIHSTGKISPTFQAKQNYQNNWAFKVIKDSGTPTLSQLIRTKYPTGLAIAGSGAHFHAAGPMGGPYANWIFSYDRTSTGLWAPYTLGPHPVPPRLLNDKSLRVSLSSDNGSTVPNLYEPVKLGQQDSLVMDFGVRALQLYRPRAMMLNLPEIDTVGHWSHRWYAEESVLYRSFDRDLGRLIQAYKRAGIYDQTLFVVTADHGMIQSPHRVLDRDAVVNQIKGLVGQNGIILTNGGGAAGPTMTSIWIKNPRQNQRVATAIYNKHYDNVSAVFYIKQKSGHFYYNLAGCEACSPNLIKTYRYLVGTEAGTTGEDIAILLRENARNSGLAQMMGRHGGADWGSQHVTMIMSGPGIRAGVSHHPARLTDIAPTVERAMGIAPKALDGIVLADAFQNPVASDVSSQTASDTTLNPYVDALSQRAQHDILLERTGKLPNFIPGNETIIHWKRRWAVTIVGGTVLVGTIVALWWLITEVRRQGTGLTWTE